MRIVFERLHNQRLSAPDFEQPADVVRWMGAVQAQDFSGAKWALALRMRSATNAAIDEAYNEGRILRTHLMRPTWHFVAPDDIRWLLQLTAPRVNARCGPNYRKYELEAAVFKRTNKILANALKGGKHLTRSELRAALNRGGVAADDPVRAAHILLRAELDAVVCSGRQIGKQFTYALVEERVPPAESLKRDEALAKLTQRYFRSHGPATLQDFVWWSGLTTTDARHAIALLDRDLRKELVNDKDYWLPRVEPSAKRSLHTAHLLPAYDEYNVAYKDRETVVEHDSGGKPRMTAWDLLNPTVVIEGKAVGTWRAKMDDHSVSIAVQSSRTLKRRENLAIAAAADRYGAFLGLSVHS
jgi:hypothetical protein